MSRLIKVFSIALVLILLLGLFPLLPVKAAPGSRLAAIWFNGETYEFKEGEPVPALPPEIKWDKNKTITLAGIRPDGENGTSIRVFNSCTIRFDGTNTIQPLKGDSYLDQQYNAIRILPIVPEIHRMEVIFEGLPGSKLIINAKELSEDHPIKYPHIDIKGAKLTLNNMDIVTNSLNDISEPSILMIGGKLVFAGNTNYICPGGRLSTAWMHPVHMSQEVYHYMESDDVYDPTNQGVIFDTCGTVSFTGRSKIIGNEDGNNWYRQGKYRGVFDHDTGGMLWMNNKGVVEFKDTAGQAAFVLAPSYSRNALVEATQVINNFGFKDPKKPGEYLDQGKIIHKDIEITNPESSQKLEYHRLYWDNSGQPRDQFYPPCQFEMDPDLQSLVSWEHVRLGGIFSQYVKAEQEVLSGGEDNVPDYRKFLCTAEDFKRDNDVDEISTDDWPHEIKPDVWAGDVIFKGAECPVTPTPITHEVKFNPNAEGDTTVAGMPSDAAEVVDGKTLTKPADPTRDNHTFAYWSTDMNATPADETTKGYDFTSPVTGDFTLYAIWEEVEEERHEVTFNANAGTDPVTGMPDPLTVEIEDGSTLDKPKSEPIRAGYSFKYWSKNKDAKPEEAVEEYDFNSPVTGRFTLFAIWEKVEDHTVTFDPNAGGNTVHDMPGPATVLHNAKLEKPSPDPRREGYNFKFWSTTKQETRAIYNFEDLVTEDFTLFAIWEKNAEPSTSESTTTSVSSETTKPSTVIIAPQYNLWTPKPSDLQAGGAVPPAKVVSKVDNAKLAPVTKAIPVTGESKLYSVLGVILLGLAAVVIFKKKA